MTTKRVPCAFFGHGGGPMPLLGQQEDVANTLRTYAATIGFKPTSILGKYTKVATFR